MVFEDDEQRRAWIKIANVVKHSRRLDSVLKGIVVTLNEHFKHYTWVGVYVLEGDELVLRAFSGPQVTQHKRISIGEGICGLAASTGATVNIPDVAKDPRYLACFPRTRSEIVVPIKEGERVYGEIDVDSDELNAFSPKDEEFLERVADLLALEFRSLS